jgi:hypothetical protein
MLKYEDYDFPKGLNLDFLLNFLSEKKLMKVIENYADKPRNQRKVILPSWSCIRKCSIYYLVEKHKGDFDVVLDILKGKEKSLGNVLLHKGNIKKLYFQRKRELENE